ncbi:unnamed protein product [Heterotrigona itama]|uniref:Reverse transcriptase domain-containing protein n=1 Tax=Heterotrigona itama TaxID=395501 RepID=A0A6V7GTT0_9HYME|nr:unnamed protein product [Heterotrigona itama]
MERVSNHLGAESNLQESSFSFRNGVSTIDAITRVRGHAKSVVSQGEMALAVYDTVLETALQADVRLTCYADEILLVAGGRDWQRIIRLTEAGVTAVTGQIKSLGLDVATKKTKANSFHGLPPTRRLPQSIGDDRIFVGRTMKYLGVTLDERMTFEWHFATLGPRVEGRRPLCCVGSSPT